MGNVAGWFDLGAPNRRARSDANYQNQLDIDQQNRAIADAKAMADKQSSDTIAANKKADDEKATTIAAQMKQKQDAEKKAIYGGAGLAQRYSTLITQPLGVPGGGTYQPVKTLLGA